VVCTDGSKGSGDPSLSPEQLAAMRQAEQRAAAELLGVKEVVFLGHPDGELAKTPALEVELALHHLINRFLHGLILADGIDAPVFDDLPHGLCFHLVALLVTDSER